MASYFKNLGQDVFNFTRAIQIKDRFHNYIGLYFGRMQHQDNIPDGLTYEEKATYRKLLQIKQKPKKVFVISDLAKDYDDLAAMLVLKELDRIKIIKLEGIVANFMPAEKRARFGRGALDALGLQHIPIAVGLPAATKYHKELPYEFKCSFMAPENTVFEKGEDLLRRICDAAMKEKEKLDFLLLSSLTDIDKFSKAYPYFKDVTSNIVLQGGYSTSPLEPDMKAANNKFDEHAAISFHHTINEKHNPSVVYTKVAAFATKLSTQLFVDMEASGHEIGKHLRHVQIIQDVRFYDDACLPNPKFMTQDFFLRNKSTWYEVFHEPGTPLPVGQEIIPYLTKVVVYDALAALGCSGPKVLKVLKIKRSSFWANVLKALRLEIELHEVVGSEGPLEIDGANMAKALAALLKGALLASQQGLKPSW